MRQHSSGSNPEVQARTAEVSPRLPQDRWSLLASEIDPRLVRQGDWPSLALLMEEAHSLGHDVADAARTLVTEEPLSELPAQDLRYRLVARLNIDIDASLPAPSSTVSTPGIALECRQPPPSSHRPPGPRR